MFSLQVKIGYTLPNQQNIQIASIVLLHVTGCNGISQRRKILLEVRIYCYSEKSALIKTWLDSLYYQFLNLIIYFNYYFEHKILPYL